MTYTDNPIPDQPHVICYVRDDGRLRAIFADNLPGVLDGETYAIFPDRHTANLAIVEINEGRTLPTVYFSVPATALFKTETKVVYTFK